MVDPYRPMSGGGLTASEIAGAAIRLGLRNYRVLVSSVGAVLLPTAVIGGIAVGYWRSTSSATQASRTSSLFAVAGFIVVIIGSLLAQAVGVYAAVSRAAGGVATWRHSIAVAKSRWKSCVGVGLVVVVLCVLGLFAFIIPGAVLYFGWFVAMPSVIIEGQSPSNALSRSWALSRGRRLSIFGSYLLIEIVILICSIPLVFIVSAVFSGASVRVDVAQQVAGYLAQIALMPLQVALVAVVYLDLRYRKEGVTAHQVAREAGIPLDETLAANAPMGWQQSPADPPYPTAGHWTERPSAPAEPPSPPSPTQGRSWQVSPKPPEPRPTRDPFAPAPPSDSPSSDAPESQEGSDGGG